VYKPDPSPQLHTRSIQHAFVLAVQHHNAGDLTEAENIYQQILQTDPNHPDALHLLGVIAHQMDKNDRAADLITKALIIKPDFAEAHSNLGAVLKELGQLDEAVKSYHKALSIKPNYAEAYSNLSVALQEMGQLEEAIVSSHKALAIRPDYARANYNLGNALKDLGQLDEAVTRYLKVLAIKPDYPEAHNNLGAALAELGRLDEAVANFRKALAIKPDFVEVHSNLGDVLKNLGKFQEAVAHYQKLFTSRTGIQPVGNGELSPATNGFFLELTNKCNFHCDFCPSDSQKRALGFMDLELAKRTYEEVANKQLVPKIDLHLMGEPTLHPKLIEILKFGASKNVRTELITNGSTLVPKVVPRILDALYGTIVASHMTPTKETYHFRGNVGLSWDRYIGNIRLLIREYMKRLTNGKDTRNEINLRVMVTKDTPSCVNIIESSEEALAILTEWVDFTADVERELGLPPFKRQELNTDTLLQRGHLEFKTYRLQRGIILTFSKDHTFANTRVGNDYDLQTREETVFCPHPFEDVGILWNGDVTLCCMDYDAQLKVGNVLDTSIETVLQSKAAQDLRSSMLGHRPLASVCQTCQARPVRRENFTTDAI